MHKVTFAIKVIEASGEECIEDANVLIGTQKRQPAAGEYDPPFLNLDHTGDWDPLWRIVPEDYTDTDWVRQLRVLTDYASND